MILSEIAQNKDSAESASEDETIGNPGMADAMRKVLQMGKNLGKSSVVLAKAKVLTDIPKTKPVGPSYEIVKNPDVNEANEVAEVKEDPEKDLKPDVKLLKRFKIKRAEVSALGRLKPSPLDRPKERPLMKLATKGVVQLFNAVREHQKVVTKRLDEEGKTETKREKILKSINKKTFLDVLRGQSVVTKNEDPEEAEVKTEDEDAKDDAPSWGVLRDDFMMGTKLKDWNREENNSDEPQPKRQKVKKSR